MNPPSHLPGSAVRSSQTWDENKSKLQKAFFLVRWDLVLLLSSSQIYFCPYSFDQKFATPTTLIHLSAFDHPKSALIYSECQMNCSCCLLSLWPQNRSLNFLWSFLCLDAKSYQYDDDRRDVKFHVLASQTIEQVTIQVCDCKLWRWSTQKAYHQYLSVSAITTNQAPYMLQQSCASLVLACQFGIGIVHLSQNIDRRIWPARMRWIPPAQSRSLSSYLIPYFSPIRFSVTEQAWARCQMGQVTVATRYCSTTAFSPILRVEVNPAQLKYQAQGSWITPVATFCAKRGRKRKRVI